MMNFIPYLDSHYQELQRLRVTSQLPPPIKVSAAL